jgi:enterochelin esterase-like enzyme
MSPHSTFSKQLMRAAPSALMLMLVPIAALLGSAQAAAQAQTYAKTQAQTQAALPAPKVSAGRIERIAAMPSRFVDARPVDVWLPPNYSPQQRYPVIYMHDGQMLFDASMTWNKQAWEVDDTLARLIQEGAIPAVIVVGIWNNANLRHSEFFPSKFLPYLDAPLRQSFVEKALAGESRADRYLQFIVQELKPMIDQRFATRPERDATFLMGSSMGGLISVYGFIEYPDVVGGAAAISTHWIGHFDANAAFPIAAFQYLSAQLTAPKSRRIYFDHGDQDLEAKYQGSQLIVNQIFLDRGYSSNSFSSQVFPGTGHNEQAWAKRLATPVQFLLASPPKKK